MKPTASIHCSTISRSGFTLVEAVLSTLVIGILATSALQGLTVTARAGIVQSDQWRGSILARQLLDEIVQQSYAEPNGTAVFGPETGETRATYDDVDDYNGVSESPPTTAAGVAIPGFTGWKRSVVVAWVSPSAPSGTASSSETGMKRVTVTVTSPRGIITTLIGLRSTYSGYQHTWGASTTYTSGVNIAVQSTSDTSTSAVSGANTMNQVP